MSQFLYVPLGLLAAVLPWDAAAACILCETELSRAVRARAFGADFLYNGVGVAMPLVILIAIIALIASGPGIRR